METFIIKAAQFLLSLSILIILHEFGHFLPAKLFKTRVEKFYLFFNPWFSLIKKKVGDTEYGIGWLPLGGYVKIAGMVDESMDTNFKDSEPKPDEFRSKPAWQRLIIMIGGVTVNVIVAIIIYAGTLAYWGEQYLPTENAKFGIMTDSLTQTMGFENGDIVHSVNGEKVENFLKIPMEIVLAQEGIIEVDRDGKRVEIPFDNESVKAIINDPILIRPRFPYQVGEFTEESMADEAGIQTGDFLVGINGEGLEFFDQYLEVVPTYAGDSITLMVNREGQMLSYDIFVPQSGKIGIRPVGNIEAFFDLETKTYGFIESIPAGVKKSYATLKNYLRQMSLIFNPKTEAYKSVGGFLTIGDQFPETWDWQFFWNFTAFLSIMLAFLNILPIPALDGGHVVFVLWEMATGRKPHDKVLEYAQIAGFVILVALMLLANGNDIIRYVFN